MRHSRAGALGRTAILAGLAAALASVPAGARADTWRGLELAARMDRAPWHFGPFIVQPTLVLANAGVDSNIYYSPTEPVRDFTLTAGPAATVYMPLARRLVLTAYGSPQYVWYSKTERERAWNFYFNGAAQLNLRSVFFSVDGVYSDARERWNTEIDLRPRRTQTGGGASMLVKTSWKTSFEVAYHLNKFDYENVDVDGSFNIRERLNRREGLGTFSFYYQAASTSRFFLDFEYGRYNFEFATVSVLKDSLSYAGYGGFEFSQLGTRVRGRIRVGYKKFHLRNPGGGPDYRGLAGDTLLSVRVARPLALRASFVRDIRFSLWYGNAYFVETRPGAGLSVYPFRLVRLDYDFSLGRSRYPVAGGGTPDQKRLDDFTTHAVGLYVRVSRTSALGFIVSRWQRNSNLNQEDDKRTFFGLNLTYDF